MPKYVDCTVLQTVVVDAVVNDMFEVSVNIGKKCGEFSGRVNLAVRPGDAYEQQLQ